MNRKTWHEVPKARDTESSRGSAGDCRRPFSCQRYLELLARVPMQIQQQAAERQRYVLVVRGPINSGSSRAWSLASPYSGIYVLPDRLTTRGCTVSATTINVRGKHSRVYALLTWIYSRVLQLACTTHISHKYLLQSRSKVLALRFRAIDSMPCKGQTLRVEWHLCARIRGARHLVFPAYRADSTSHGYSESSVEYVQGTSVFSICIVTRHSSFVSLRCTTLLERGADDSRIWHKSTPRRLWQVRTHFSLLRRAENSRVT